MKEWWEFSLFSPLNWIDCVFLIDTINTIAAISRWCTDQKLHIMFQGQAIHPILLQTTEIQRFQSLPTRFPVFIVVRQRKKFHSMRWRSNSLHRNTADRRYAALTNSRIQSSFNRFYSQIQSRTRYHTLMPAVNCWCRLSRRKYSWHRRLAASIIRAKSNTDQLVWYDRSWPSNSARTSNSAEARRNRQHILRGITHATSWTIDGSMKLNWHQEEENCSVSIIQNAILIMKYF